MVAIVYFISFFFTVGSEVPFYADDEGEVRYGLGFLELQKSGSILFFSRWLPLPCIVFIVRCAIWKHPVKFI